MKFLLISVNSKNSMKKIFSTKIKIFQSDGGLEFDNSPLKQHFLDKGIYFQKSC